MRTVLFILSTAIATAQSNSAITQAERLKWATFASVGPSNLAAGVYTSAITTAKNRPPEYGTHWEGYGKRQGLRLTGAVTSNFMEAELGALWGEDPRYRRATGKSANGRAWHAVKTAFLSYDREGHVMPAYARFIAVPTSNVIANSWRPDSQHTASQTMTRISLGFMSRIISDSFIEFWPDIRKHVLHRK